MVYRGRVQGGVVVLDEPLALPDGTAVSVQPLPNERGKSLAERFKEIIGAVPDLPSDMAENHDHYLHGMPRK